MRFLIGDESPRMRALRRAPRSSPATPRKARCCAAAGSPSRWERRLFFQHTCIFQHVCPFPTSACVTVLEMLAEMVCPEELLRAIALPELVVVL